MHSGSDVEKQSQIQRRHGTRWTVGQHLDRPEPTLLRYRHRARNDYLILAALCEHPPEVKSAQFSMICMLSVLLCRHIPRGGTSIEDYNWSNRFQPAFYHFVCSCVLHGYMGY